jgi:glycosyltransferase involved in cell wall biosynthesis
VVVSKIGLLAAEIPEVLNGNPFFSFVMPTFNRAYCIEAGINSILNQVGLSPEILVIDDGSTDDTGTLLNKYQQLNFHYHCIPENGGTNNAKNLGAKLAKGKWLVFLDSDDLLMSGGLEKMAQCIESHADADLFFFACENLEGQPTSETPHYHDYVSFRDYLQEKVKGEYLPVVRQNVFLKYGFAPNKQGAEGVTWLSILKKSRGFVSNQVLRQYNHLATDRISAAGKYTELARLRPHLWNRNLRLALAHALMLNTHGLALLRYSPRRLVLILAKVLYYRLAYLLR